MLISTLFKIILCFFISVEYAICMDTEQQQYKIPHITLESKIKSHNDPSFFRFKTNTNTNTNTERTIYLLGTHHFVPLRHFFHQKTLEELRKISNNGAIFYSEHAYSNAVNLNYLNDSDNIIPHEDLKKDVTLLNMGGVDGVNTDLNNDDKALLYDKKLMLDLRNSSTINFSEALKARLWLGAVILGTHASLLSYSMFGGTELDLIQGEFQGKWREIKDLEDTKDVIKILKNNREHDEDTKQNISWIKKSINKILVFAKKDNDTIKKLIEEEYDASIKDYRGWQIISHDGRGVPKSVFERNRHWVSTIIKELGAGGDVPLFIVVGSGHFAGGDNGFLRLLLKAVDGAKLERFNNKGEWVELAH